MSGRRGTSGNRVPKATTKEKFPIRPPYVSNSDGKTVTPKRVIQRPDRSLTLKRIDANLE